jgi:hypothetical protein
MSQHIAMTRATMMTMTMAGTATMVVAVGKVRGFGKIEGVAKAPVATEMVARRGKVTKVREERSVVLTLPTIVPVRVLRITPPGGDGKVHHRRT